MSFKQIVSYYSKQAKNFYLGKIDWHLSGYSYGDDGWTNKQGVHFKSHIADEGLPVKLNGVISVCCPIKKTEASPLVREYYSVPKRICNKCEHRLKGGYCAELRRLRRLEK